MIRAMRRLCRAGLIAVLVGPLIAGCTMQTNGVDSTIAAHIPILQPGPPPRIVPPAAPGPLGPPPNGNFAGAGRLSSSAGSGCRAYIPVNGMVVAGSRVRYQGFRGTVLPDGFVRMQAGGAYLYGIFDGPGFTGHLWRPHPQCTYDLALEHTG